MKLYQNYFVHHYKMNQFKRDAGLIREQYPVPYSLQETLFIYKDKDRWKVNRCREINYANLNQKKSEIALVISETTDFKVREVV